MSDSTSIARHLRAVALACAARGWPVFPLVPGGKAPALHGYARCPRAGACAAGHVGWERRATTDPEVIERCWSSGPYNVGIATGPAGLVVVDLDVPKPGTPVPAPLAEQGVTGGLDAFLLLCAEAGQTPPLDTRTVTTPSGGMHLYFTAPDGLVLRNTSGERGRGLGWCIDTRAHGGYVLAPGSVVDGRAYTLTEGRDPAPLPGWLAARLAPAPLPPQRPTPVRVAGARRSRYLEAALAAEVARVEGAAKGQRNHALYVAAVALGQLVAGGALTEQEVRDVLLRAAAGHLAAGAYSPHQAELTITSGLRAGAKRPRTLPAGERAA